jgi:hypothetical protein
MESLIRTCMMLAVVTSTDVWAQSPKSGALSDADVVALIVKQSRDDYYRTGHPCACPDDHMRNGNRCGAVSAYIRPGGAHPLCSAADVTPDMIDQYRRRR